MASEIRFTLLGPVAAWRGATQLNVGYPKQRAVLAALLLNEGRQTALEELVDAVWDGAPPPTAAATIRTYVYRLRQALGEGGDGLIRSADGGYALVTEPGTVDLGRFGELWSRATTARDDGDSAVAQSLLSDGLALWSGTALAGVPGSAAARKRAQLEELRLTTVEARLFCMLELGRHAEAAVELTYLVAAHPLREGFRELLMVALYGAGRQADALSTFDDLRRVLREELGIDPAPRLQELHRRILRADPGLRSAPTAALSSAASARVDLTLPGPIRTPAGAQADAEVSGPAVAAAVPFPRPAAVPGPVPVVRPAQLPAGLPHFVGRKDELDYVRALLAEDERASAGTTIVVIEGMAGIGKTSLAQRVALEAAPRFPDGQLYVDLRGFDPDGNGAEPAEVLGEFLQALGVAAQDIPGSLAARASLYRSVLAGRRVLVLLDNARDPQQVRHLLPGTPGCPAVITSRNQLSGLVATYQARPLRLGLLDGEEAHELLIRRLGRQRVAAEPRAVQEIIAYCGRLPLALAVVAARAAQNPAFPLSAVAEELRRSYGGLDAFSGDDDPATDARAVFSWSYEALNPDAARLFRLLALHPGPDVTADAAASLIALPLRPTRRLLAGLSRAHLLTEHAPGRYTFHDLLRAYAAELTDERDSAEERAAALTRILDHYLHSAHSAARSISVTLHPLSLPQPNPGVLSEDVAGHEESSAWLRAEQHVLVAVVMEAAERGYDTHVCGLARVLEDFLDQRGLWHDLAATQRGALEAATRLGDPVAQAYSHRGLGRAEANLGRFEAARDHVDQALVLFGESDDVTRAQTHLQFSWMLDQQDFSDAAVSHARQALALHSTLGEQSSQAFALGWLDTLTGRHQQALTHCWRAMDLLMDVECPVGQANTLVGLGNAHHFLGQYSEALTSFEQALGLYRRLGFRYPEASTLTRLGDSRLASGRTESARAAWTEALTILTRLERPDADRVRSRLNRLDRS